MRLKSFTLEKGKTSQGVWAAAEDSQTLQSWSVNIWLISSYPYPSLKHPALVVFTILDDNYDNVNYLRKMECAQ